MGMKKVGKRLLKLGQKTAKTLGKEGRKRVEELFSTAIEKLEHELQEKGGTSVATKAKTAARTSKRPRRGAAVARRAVRAEPRIDAVEEKKAASGGGRVPRGLATAGQAVPPAAPVALPVAPASKPAAGEVSRRKAPPKPVV